MYLNCHSTYSVQYGTLSVQQLVEQAVQWKVRTLALTDINNGTGIFEFVKLCNEHGIKPIVGIEFRDKANKVLYIGLARNNEGYTELNKFLSHHLVSDIPLPERATDFNNVAIIYPTHNVPLQLKPYEYIGIRPSELTKFEIRLQKNELRQAVILQPVTYLNKEGRELHTRLRAIYHNTLLTMLTAEMKGGSDEFMLEPYRINSRFASYPELLLNTQALLDSCSFTFDFKKPKNKRTYTGTLRDDRALLHKLAMDGLQKRYGANNKVAIQRVQQELEVIDKMGFACYYLTTREMIRYSQEMMFPHVGRGSGANSIVAYCMEITDVDPIKFNLFFERFLNEKRTSPPDFDIDYSWKDRDKVIDYVLKRFGQDHTALLGTVTTFKRRSVLRELGKVYGLPQGELDSMAEKADFNFNRDHVTKEIHRFAQMMTGFPNHTSIHAGGILISEEPIYNYSALYLPRKGFPTVQWDMYTADDISFHKLDVLSQRGLGHIYEAVDIIENNRGIKVNIRDVNAFMEDPKVKAQLKSGDTIGCFYIESPAMRQLLKKLRCDDYLTLVAASSIIRPGVASSGMMGEYIYRYNNPDNFEYLHPVMKEHLSETFGIMVYQEDVILVCSVWAGLSMVEGDIIRRNLTGKAKTRGEMELVEKSFFEGAARLERPVNITNELWRQISSFAGYSFCKAHSASYAVESYQSLKLRTDYPIEFYVAVANNFGGFYQTWVYIHECRKAGATIHPPCVNNSDWLTTVKGTDVYLGFILISSIEEKVAQRILRNRFEECLFYDLEDFVRRTKITKEQLNLLIRAGALRFTGKTKKQLLWEATTLTDNKEIKAVSEELFPVPVKKFTLPVLRYNSIEDAYDELEIFGFTVTKSVFEMVKLPDIAHITAKELLQHTGKNITILGLFIAPKDVITKYGEHMAFAAFLDINGDYFDTTHFPEQLAKHPLNGAGVYVIHGKAVQEFGYPSIEVKWIEKLAMLPDPRFN